jgi:dissimilatory sulfite reductase (desulfoviridin) alpha/beta subunit
VNFLRSGRGRAPIGKVSMRQDSYSLEPDKLFKLNFVANKLNTSKAHLVREGIDLILLKHSDLTEEAEKELEAENK